MLDAIEVETAANPNAAVIVLHGLGADGRDFVPICDELDLSDVGSVRFVFPHARERPVTVNGGMIMRAWYDIFAFGLMGPEDEAGLRDSLKDIEALIAREQQRGIPPERIVLMGFSQGCAMVLLTGLRHVGPLAGIAGLSGYLPLAAKTQAECSADSKKLPIFLAHGSLDPVVPMALGVRSRDALQAWGYDVQWHPYAMPHSVCPQEIVDLNAWLLRVLGA